MALTTTTVESTEYAYSLIDPVLQQWSTKHSRRLVKLFNGAPMRGFNIVSPKRDHVEIFIGVPQNGMVDIAVGGVWPSRQLLKTATIPISQLAAALDNALELANSWFAKQIH